MLLAFFWLFFSAYAGKKIANASGKVLFSFAVKSCRFSYCPVSSILFILFWLCVVNMQIVPAKCRYDVLSSKVEIRLWKAEPITWTSLEFSDKRAVPQKMSNIPGSLYFFFLFHVILLHFSSSYGIMRLFSKLW